MATVLKTKFILSAICIAALATGCSRNESQPAPAPVAPQEEPKPQPQPNPVVPKGDEPKRDDSAAKSEQPEQKPEQKAEQQQPAQPVAPEAKSEAQQEETPQAPVAEAPKAEQDQPTQQEPKAEAEQKQEPQIETLESKVRAASEKYGFLILVAQKLTTEEVAKGLQTLDEVMAKVQQYHAKTPAKAGEAPRLEPLFDYMVLSSKNEPITEHREDLRVKFDTEEDVSRAVSMLKYEFLNCEQKASGEPKSAERFKGCKEFYRTRHIEAFRKARTELNSIRSELSPLKIQCGPKGTLAVETCVQGARTLRSVVGLVNKNVMGSIKTVTIYPWSPAARMIPVSVNLNAEGERNMDLFRAANPESVARELHDQAIAEVQENK